MAFHLFLVVEVAKELWKRLNVYTVFERQHLSSSVSARTDIVTRSPSINIYIFPQTLSGMYSSYIMSSQVM